MYCTHRIYIYIVYNIISIYFYLFTPGSAEPRTQLPKISTVFYGFPKINTPLEVAHLK